MLSIIARKTFLRKRRQKIWCDRSITLRHPTVETGPQRAIWQSTEVNIRDSAPAQSCQTICSLLPAQAYLVRPAGGSEGVMPERANSLASAILAGALAAAAILGLDTAASAAADCLENPNLRITQPGHWYYHSDRTQNRKCWYFQPAEVGPPEATADAPAYQPATAGREDAQQSILSRFATDFVQSFHSQPQQRETQQNSIPANSVEATQTVSPRPAKPDRAARWERPRVAPLPTTTGAASAEKDDQPQRPAVDKNEQRDPPSNVAEREALFQNFVKWQMEKDVFGR